MHAMRRIVGRASPNPTKENLIKDIKESVQGFFSQKKKKKSQFYFTLPKLYFKIGQAPTDLKDVLKLFCTETLQIESPPQLRTDYRLRFKQYNWMVFYSLFL